MKWLLITISLVAAAAEAQIYRCETPAGPVFSDNCCSAEAEVVIVEIDSAAISGGTSDEVRAELVLKKAQRAEAQEQARKLRASQPPQPVYLPVRAEKTVVYPGYWPWRPGYRPHPRHPRPQPKPEQPARPPLLPDTGGSVIRIPKR